MDNIRKAIKEKAIVILGANDVSLRFYTKLRELGFKGKIIVCAQPEDDLDYIGNLHDVRVYDDCTALKFSLAESKMTKNNIDTQSESVVSRLLGIATTNYDYIIDAIDLQGCTKTISMSQSEAIKHAEVGLDYDLAAFYERYVKQSSIEHMMFKELDANLANVFINEMFEGVGFESNAHNYFSLRRTEGGYIHTMQLYHRADALAERLVNDCGWPFVLKHRSFPLAEDIVSIYGATEKELNAMGKEYLCAVSYSENDGNSGFLKVLYDRDACVLGIASFDESVAASILASILNCGGDIRGASSFVYYIDLLIGHIAKTMEYSLAGRLTLGYWDEYWEGGYVILHVESNEDRPHEQYLVQLIMSKGESKLPRIIEAYDSVDEAIKRLNKGVKYMVSCADGTISTSVAATIAAYGFDARVLVGGVRYSFLMKVKTRAKVTE